MKTFTYILLIVFLSWAQTCYQISAYLQRVELTVAESSEHLALVSRGPRRDTECRIVWRTNRETGMSFSDGSAWRAKDRVRETI